MAIGLSRESPSRNASVVRCMEDAVEMDTQLPAPREVLFVLFVLFFPIAALYINIHGY